MKKSLAAKTHVAVGSIPIVPMKRYGKHMLFLLETGQTDTQARPAGGCREGRKSCCLLGDFLTQVNENSIESGDIAQWQSIFGGLKKSQTATIWPRKPLFAGSTPAVPVIWLGDVAQMVRA